MRDTSGTNGVLRDMELDLVENPAEADHPVLDVGSSWRRQSSTSLAVDGRRSGFIVESSREDLISIAQSSVVELWGCLWRLPYSELWTHLGEDFLFHCQVQGGLITNPSKGVASESRWPMSCVLHHSSARYVVISCCLFHVVFGSRHAQHGLTRFLSNLPFLVGGRLG